MSAWSHSRCLTMFLLRSRDRELRQLNICRFLQTVNNLNNVPSVSTSQIKNILKTMKVVHSDGYTCLALKSCPIGCHDRESEKKFYINKITGLFVCHSCGRTGPWTWLQQRLTDRHKNNSTVVTAMSRSHSVPLPSDQCVAVENVDADSLDKCLATLQLSHITRECLAMLGASVKVGESRLLLPLRAPDDIVGAWKSLTPDDDPESVRPVEEVLGLRPSSSSKSPLLLTNEMACSGTELVLVPSAADLLALSSQNILGACLASGAGHLPQEVLPSLEHFSKITLWFDKHTDAARTFARKLGESRCFLTRPTDTLRGAHEEVRRKGRRSHLLNVIKSAQPVTHPSITNFASLRSDVYSELSNENIARGLPWLRFPQLTNILGGFRRGELTVLTGPTGSGKTTFISEYSLDLCQQGVNTLWGSFEIRNSRLARTMITQLAGLRLEDHMDRFEEFADLMEQLPLHFMAFHGQQPLKSVMEAVTHAAYVYDLGHLVVDNLQFMLGLSATEAGHFDRFYRQDMVIEAFRSFATCYNCHVTLVIHPRKESAGELLTMASIFGGAKATQESDNVLLMQDQVTSMGKTKKFLQIAKNRYSGDLGVMNLDFDGNSLSFMKKKKSADADGTNKQPIKPQVPVMPVPSFLIAQQKVNDLNTAQQVNPKAR